MNVRRFFLIVKESIDAGTQWVVLEPKYKLLCVDEPTGSAFFDGCTARG